MAKHILVITSVGFNIVDALVSFYLTIGMVNFSLSLVAVPGYSSLLTYFLTYIACSYIAFVIFLWIVK